MSHHDNHVEVKNPGSLKTPSWLKTLFIACAVIGAILFAAALKSDAERAWPNFLVNFFYFLMLSLFGAFFTALQHITNAYWSVTVRRLMEGLMSYLPFAFVLAIVLLVFGSHHLYEWTHPDVVASDSLLSGKQGYLNTTFFAIRLVIYFSIWIGLGWKMRKNSLEQDKTGDPQLTLSNLKLAGAFLPAFALTVTLAGFDLIMSLEPHWFSTIFGIYCFSGLFYSGLALLAFLTIQAKKQGILDDKLVNDNHIHDIGKFMFGFTVFWAYIMFSQLMLQWYANLPEEIPYYIRRFNGGWWTFGGFLLLVHFVIPFFGLLPREAKRCSSLLSKMSLFMLFAQWLDVYYLVMPVFYKAGPVFGWIEVGTFLGFFGIFGISISRFYEKVPVIPYRDPRLAQCLAHTQ